MKVWPGNGFLYIKNSIRIGSWRISLFIYSLSSIFVSAQIGRAEISRPVTLTEVEVTLLRQPCLLMGPLSKETLLSIHAIGPDQVYPNFNLSKISDGLKQLEKSMKTLETTTSIIPPEFNSYREKLRRRFRAQKDFLQLIHQNQSLTEDELRSLSKHGNLPFSSLKSRNSSQLKKKQEFENAIDQWKKAPRSEKDDRLTSVFEAFSDLVQVDPQTEFHDTTQRLGIEYRCTLEDHDPMQEEEDSSLQQHSADPR